MMGTWEKLAKRIRASLGLSSSSPQRKPTDRSARLSFSECSIGDDIWIMVDVDKEEENRRAMPFDKKKKISRTFLVRDLISAEKKCAIFQPQTEEQITEERFDTNYFDLLINNMILSRYNCSQWLLQVSGCPALDQEQQIIHAIEPFCNASYPRLDDFVAHAALRTVSTLKRRKQIFAKDSMCLTLLVTDDVAAVADIEIQLLPADNPAEAVDLLEKTAADLGFSPLKELTT